MEDLNRPSMSSTSLSVITITSQMDKSSGIQDTGKLPGGSYQTCHNKQTMNSGSELRMNLNLVLHIRL